MKTIMTLFRTSVKHSIFIMIAAVCFGPAAAQNVFAQEQGPCADDVAKFCKEVKPGGGGIAKCLKEHANDLSAACKEQISEAKQKVQDFKEACKSDLTKFCKDVKPGGGRILQCLKGHEAELSPECKAKMTK